MSGMEHFKSSLAFYLLFFNASFLCWYFVNLFIHSSVIVSEPNKLIAGGEVIFTAMIALFAFERLLNFGKVRKGNG